MQISDEMFIAAAEAVSTAGYGSNWVVRNALGIGYHRANELIKALQAQGVLACELDHEAKLELLRPIGFY
jgi:DNA segregation ATPase FtsK/SpoIIIE-like protein